MLPRAQEPSFSRFGRSQWIGTCRSRLQSIDLAEGQSAIRRQIRQSCPAAPGVYGLIDRAGELIYVGKAKSLRDRLLSYFAKAHSAANAPVNSQRGDDQKSIRLGQRAVRIVYERVSHEFAALVRELELIRRFRPRANVQGQPGRVRRGFLCLGRAPAPRAYLSPTLTTTAETSYGPLAIGRRMRRAVERLNTTFRLRDCADDVPMRFGDQRLLLDEPLEPLCPRFDFGLCMAPCAGRCDRREYHAAVRAAQAFVEGTDDSALATLEQEMQRAALGRQFERAALLRDTIDDLRYVQLQVMHIRAVQRWAFVYCPPSTGQRRTWYFVRHGVPVAAIRRPTTADQARRALGLIEQHLLSTSGPSIDRETLPYVLLVARWFHYSPREMQHAVSSESAEAWCRQLLDSGRCLAAG